MCYHNPAPPSLPLLTAPSSNFKYPVCSASLDHHTSMTQVQVYCCHTEAHSFHMKDLMPVLCNYFADAMLCNESVTAQSCIHSFPACLHHITSSSCHFSDAERALPSCPSVTAAFLGLSHLTPTPPSSQTSNQTYRPI